jgi:hypothetical protein
MKKISSFRLRTTADIMLVNLVDCLPKGNCSITINETLPQMQERWINFDLLQKFLLKNKHENVVNELRRELLEKS